MQYNPFFMSKTFPILLSFCPCHRLSACVVIWPANSFLYHRVLQCMFILSNIFRFWIKWRGGGSYINTITFHKGETQKCLFPFQNWFYTVCDLSWLCAHNIFTYTGIRIQYAQSETGILVRVKNQIKYCTSEILIRKQTLCFLWSTITFLVKHLTFRALGICVLSLLPIHLEQICWRIRSYEYKIFPITPSLSSSFLIMTVF